MGIKHSVKRYFHHLYRTLKLVDEKLHEHNDEEMVNELIEGIVKSDALISLLVYVDNSIPLIRCQKAFASIKSELDGLRYLYREQRLIGDKHHPTLGWQMGKAIDLDISILADKYKSQSNDIYLNTIHATEHAIGTHINRISDEQFTIGTMAYFTDCLEEISAFDLDKRIEEVGYLIRSLLANLQFVSYIANNKKILKGEQFFDIIINAVGILKTMHVYQMTLKSMGSNNQIVGDLASSLQLEYDKNMSELSIEYLSIVDAKEEIISYVRKSIIKEKKISNKSIKESIHARNLLHSYT